MGLRDIVRSGVAIANSVTRGLQTTVSLNRWTLSTDGYGTPEYDVLEDVSALVDYTQKPVQTSSGTLIMSRAQVTFLQPLDPQGAEGRVEPLDPRDTIELPDGTVGKIVRVNGLIDPVLGRPYLLEVMVA